MKNLYNAFNYLRSHPRLRRILRISARIVATLTLLATVAYVGLAWYIYSHKKEVTAQVLEALNDELTGTIAVDDLEPTFLQGFPRISLRLNNVVLRDSLFSKHGHTLSRATDVNLSVNTLALLRGTILIKKVSIKDAVIDLFTDGTGYSNSTVFKKKKKTAAGSGGSFPELKEFELDNVAIAIDNRMRSKLYKFKANELSGDLDYDSKGWEADIKLNTFVQSLAFNTRKGSFIKNRAVSGNLDITYNEETGDISFRKNKMVIGGENFNIAARFKTGAATAPFSINIENKKILWHKASHLLSPNITRKLDMFKLDKPISVKCDIIGDFNVEGDPLIRVNAEVSDNVLDTPGGVVTDCSFFGVFTNEHIKGKGKTDANSAIKLFGFKGNYGKIPFIMKEAFILDLDNPIATGNFKSDFDIANLKSLVDDDLLKFSKGKANVELNFKAGIVDFKLSKPLVSGFVKINDATVSYVPRNLNFKDIDVALNFTKDDLYISKIDLKSGKSVVQMEGNIKNFLNLYYTDPEKIVLNWEMYSPQLHLAEFMGFAGTRKSAKTSKLPSATKANFTEDLNMLFEKSNVDMKLRVDKLYYNKFYASDARADILLTDNGLIIKNAALKHAGGTIRVDGRLVQGGSAVNRYAINATVANVNIHTFFEAFDNFGMETLKSENLKGFLSSKASIAGRMTDDGAMVPRSMDGKLTFVLNKGVLVNFDPVRNVGKFAFPNRDMNNIVFTNLGGRFDVNGEKVTIHPMKISSSVLNMDIAGTYSFGKGTSIGVDVPIRNPKRDEGITDEAELAKRRNRGIVLHLVAEDDKDGSVKVKLGKRKKE